MRIHQLRSQGCEESGRDRTPPRSGRQGPARRVGCRLASLALAGAVGAAALLWAAPAQGAPTITSVETIHPYVLEVTLSEAIGPHGGRGGRHHGHRQRHRLSGLDSNTDVCREGPELRDVAG